MPLPALAALLPALQGAGAAGAAGGISGALSNPAVQAGLVQGASSLKKKSEEQEQKAAEAPIAQMIPQSSAQTADPMAAQRRLNAIMRG